jgi:predicted component of type VI protein secretion system
MTVGRGEGNHIVLPNNSVSLQHARITFDGARYHIADMNSTNGTFLGGTRLLPGVQEVWPPETPVKIGDFWLKLTPAARAAAGQTPAMANLQPHSAASGTFVTSPPKAALHWPDRPPGRDSNPTISPARRQPQPDPPEPAAGGHFTRRSGVPDSWVSLPPPFS